MTSMIDFDLAERVRVTGDNPLVPFLRRNPDVPVRIRAARLRRLDTPLVQLLLAAAADRRRRGVGFVVEGLSPAQRAVLAALGVTDAVLPMEGGE